MSSTGKPPYSSVIRNSITCEGIPPQFKDKLIAKAHFAWFGKISTITLHPTDPSCTVVYENTQGAMLALEQGGQFKDVKFRIRLTERDDDDGSTTAGPSRGLFSSVAYNSRNISGTHLEPPFESVSDSWMEKPNLCSILAGGSKAVETIDRKLLQARDYVHRLGTRPAHTAEMRYQVLQAKDHYIRLCLERASDTRKVKHIKGTCPNMCPEKESYLRQCKGMVPPYERNSVIRNGILIDLEKAIKQYPRGNTDEEPPLPHELRTEQALGRTMHFLLANVVAECDSDKGVNVVERFNYILDRTRAIRSDIAQQDLCSQTAVTLVEQCARFHIHCAARFVVKESALFDQQFNTENLKDCLQTLKRMYAVMEQRGESCSSEAEFRAYLLLLHLNDEGITLELQQMSSTLVNTPEVQFALSVHAALTQNNYVRFFELLRATNYMNACIMHRYFTQVRENALFMMRKVNFSRKMTTRFELAKLTRTLCFEDEKDAQGFFEYYGVSVNRASGMVVLKPTFAPNQPAVPYWNGPAIRMVAYKRICSVGQTICGEPLDRWGAQFPLAQYVSNFDARGRLRKEILEEILGTLDMAVPSKSLETTKTASMPEGAWKSAKRNERTNIFDAVMQDTLSNDGYCTPQPTEFHHRPWNFSCQSQRSMKGSDPVNRKNEPWHLQLDDDSAQKRDQKQHKHLAENRRVVIGEAIEVIDLVDSDSDECILVIPKKDENNIDERLMKKQEESKLLQDWEHHSMTQAASFAMPDEELEYKLSQDSPVKVLQKKTQQDNLEHLTAAGEHKVQHLQKTESAGVKESNDATSVDLFESISEEEFWDLMEQNDQTNRKCIENYRCIDASSNRAPVKIRNQAKDANQNRLGKGEDESETIQQQENDSEILQSPVEMKQTGDATLAYLFDGFSSVAIQEAHQQSEDDDLPCAAMEKMELGEEYLQEDQIGGVERPTQAAVDDLLDSKSSNVQLKFPREIDWNYFDMEKNQQEKTGRADYACIDDRVDSTSTYDCQEFAEDRECASRIHFEKKKKYNECELLQEHNSVAMAQANDAKLIEAALVSRIDECALLQEHTYSAMEQADYAKLTNDASSTDVHLPQDCRGFVMKRPTNVAFDDFPGPSSTRVDIQAGQKLNERESRPNIEKKEDELTQPKERRLSVNEEPNDVASMWNDIERTNKPATNEAIQERQDQNEPVYRNLLQEEETLSQKRWRSVMERSPNVKSTPKDVQGSISIRDDILQIQQRRECDNGVLFRVKEEEEDETEQSHERRCCVMEYASDPSTLDEQSDYSSNCSDSQEECENDERQERDQSSDADAWAIGASTDDQNDSSSITERSSDASLHYFASVSSSSPEQTEYKIAEDEEKPEDMRLQNLMPAAKYRSCKATLEDLLDSISDDAIQESAENEAAWHRLIELYSDKMLSELEDDILAEVIDESVRAELEELEQVRRKQHLLAYKYWHRWVYTVRVAARFHLLLRSVSPTSFNAHSSRSQRVLCEAITCHEPIDPFAVLDHAIQSDVHSRSAPCYWKLVFSLCSTDTNDTFESFNTFVDCWLRKSAFKRDPDYEQPGHTYLFYARRASPAEAAICMRLIGGGSAGYETVIDRTKVIERSNGLLFIMHNYEPIAHVRERLRRLLANVDIPPPAIAILHFCPSRCHPVNVGKELELDKETFRWKVFRWRDKADNDPLRAATVFLAGCYRDQLHNAFEDPERLEMCPLITFLHQSVGTDMWFRLAQACYTEAAFIKDGTLGKLVRDGNEIVRRYNEALGRVRHIVTRKEISSFARLAEEFDPLRARREGRAVGGVSEALFAPDWHSAERRHQIAQLLDGLQLHAPPERLLAAIDRAAGEKMEKGRVLDSAELRVALDYYLSDYGVILAEDSCQRQKLVKELAQEVISQLNGSRSFPEQTAGRAGAAMPRHFSWFPLLAIVSDTLLCSTVLAMKLPAEVYYRRGELRRYLRTVWGIQQYVSQACFAKRSTTTITQSPSVGTSLVTPGTTETSVLYTSTPNQKRQATTTISSLRTFAAKRIMKDKSGST